MEEHNCESLDKAFGEIEAQILKARAISLYLDFDGTLAPIAADPGEVRLPDSTRAALERVAWRARMLAAIISGRSLFDVRKRVGVPGLVYGGNHGMEINGSGLMFVEPTAAACQESLARICDDLEARLKAIPGAQIENKRLTATLHYRRVREEDVRAAKEALFASLEPHNQVFRVDPGRKALEILPQTNWNKGSAVQLIQDFLAESGSLILYFGDDRSDEYAFEALPNAITVKVGNPQDSAARYWVENPEKVGEFLQWLADAAPSGRPSLEGISR